MGRIRVESVELRRLSSDDQIDVCLLRPDALAVARLAPYPGWDEFIERVRRDWAISNDILGRLRLSRIGLRFINRIDVPISSGTIRVEDYLTVLAKPPDADENPLAEFRLQTRQFFADMNLELRLTSGPWTSPLSEHISMLLDLDVVRRNEIPSKDEGLWQLLQLMRELKNHTFEACITKKSRELFENE